MSAATKKPEVNFTNPNKVLFPETGFTKGDLIQYYIGVAPYLLPHLKDRPITLIRFPDGVGAESFYEKNAPKFRPSWVKTTAVARQHHRGSINYTLINDVRTLAWCANLAAIELHPFLHKAKNIDCPTAVAFDLDPGEGAGLAQCAEVAFLVKELLDQLGLESYPKFSGSKGVQVYVPLNTPTTYAVTTPFAKAMAELLEQKNPDLVVSNMLKELRQKKVLIDWSQNSRSKTTVGVYSVRGKRGTPYVSMPVTWDELRAVQRSKKNDAFLFQPDEALKRLNKLGDLFAPVLKTKQQLPKNFAISSAGSGKKPTRQTRATAPVPAAAQTPPKAALAKYRAKRNFDVTREPAPEADSKAKGAPGKLRNFVIQKHAASHLHFDLRFELEGTLKSWAVPKGLPYELDVKRSAFQVEDHPLSYMRFEGTIPQGQYGGGTVMVWDIGTYEIVQGSYRDERFHFVLHGKKLQGEWRIFRIRSDDDKPVWLISRAGDAMKPLTAKQEDQSALSKRSMAQIAADNDAQWQSKPR